MQDTETDAPVEAQTPPEPPLVEVGTYPDHFYQEAQATFVIPKEPPRRSVRRSFFSPIGVVFISSLLMIISNFNDFAKIWAMTQGGPGYSTTTLVIYVYRLAFENFDFGYASAIGVVWLVLLLVFALVYLRAIRMNP